MITDTIVNDFKLIDENLGKTLDTLKGSKILITGACGMIASYLSYFLLTVASRLDLEIYLQCRDMNKGERTYSDFLKGGKGHIVNFPLEEKIPGDGYDYIVHGASLCSTKHFLEHPVDVISPNVLGTYNLLEFARHKGVRNFVFLSSNSIYGEGGLQKTVLSEDDYGIVDPLNERGCYIEGKRCGEQLCAAFSRQYGVRTGIVRICHTYGPTFDIKNDSRILPRIIKEILEGKDIAIYKDPNSVIQYTYIADIVTAILRVMADGASGTAYNACGDEITGMEEVASLMVSSDSRIRSRLVEIPIDADYSFTAGKGINFLKLDNAKIKELGWKQMFSLENGLKRTVQSYLFESKGLIL